MSESKKIFHPDRSAILLVLSVMCVGKVTGTSLVSSTHTNQLSASLGSEELVQLRPNHTETVAKWVTVIDEFLNSSGASKSDLEALHPCTHERNYNYDRLAPCVFFSLKMTSDPSPQPYTTHEGLPDAMPQSLKSHIRAVEGHLQSGMVWLSCEGGSPSDAEAVGPMMYLPSRGFPVPARAPTNNVSAGYSPIVAVMFQKPNTGVTINIVCKIWATNADSSISFKLRVDKF